ASGSVKTLDINYFFPPKILNFLELNSKNIDKVIFTGDVFQFPSILKWNKLDNTFGLNFEVHIAPGNHDLLRPDSRDVFLQSKYGLKKYPYSIELMKNVLIIDDSTSSKWNVSSETIREILKNKNKLSIVARHNTPIKELLNYVNSSLGIRTNLMSYNDLKKIIPKTNKVVWVIGDSGAFEDLPRITCYKRDNHTFILNGIGEIKNDTIILLNQNNLYSYVLEQI
ncbi:metallophosphoesterase, partial [Pelagibacteraceae bacterium]|nr:metallophosphoesterase [Pelagibacteraceae bacterium]